MAVSVCVFTLQQQENGAKNANSVVTGASATLHRSYMQHLLAS
jgi:hypothetical protein